MKMPRGRWFCVLLLSVGFVGTLLFGALGSRAQQAAREAIVGVGIKVGAIAQIEFPQGTGFALDIPSRAEGIAGRGPSAPGRAPHVDTAQIPFSVTGNAWVTVSVEPGAVMGSPPVGPVGRAFPNDLVGKALPDDPSGPNKGVELPYQLWLEFPKASLASSPVGLGNPSGRNPAHHKVLRASVAKGPVFGIVHVVPGITWGEIASRNFDNPGLYFGSVQVTVTASEN